MNAEFQVLELEIPQELAGQRLDSALARLLPEHSRTRIKAWIEAGQVEVGRLPSKPRDKVAGGARIRLTLGERSPDREVLAEAIPLDVVYEDEEVLVIAKPAGLVVHPGAGNTRHTLQNALLGRDSALASLPRAGIVHRLDKDTSGLLVIARTPRAQTALSRQLLARAVAREYLAICVGVMTGGGTVDEPIGRHRSERRTSPTALGEETSCRRKNAPASLRRLSNSQWRVIGRLTLPTAPRGHRSTIASD